MKTASYNNPAVSLVSGGYILLEPSMVGSRVTEVSTLQEYLPLIFNTFLSLCVFLAIIMIVYGGFQYITSGLPGAKETGKQRINNAIFGLLLALAAWLLLYTINPDLVTLNSLSL